MKRHVWTPDEKKIVRLLVRCRIHQGVVASIFDVSTGAITALVKREGWTGCQHILGDIDPKILRWLVEITPDDAEVSDTVRSILVDAYHDEVGE